MKNKFYPKLFERGYVGNVEVKNRAVRMPMGTELGNPDGSPSWATLKAYAEAGDGGTGIVFMDNAGVTQFHHVGLSIASDPYIGPMSLLAKTIKQHGAVPGLQIVHPGRDAAFVRGDDLISSSRIMWEPWYENGGGVPRELSIEEIHQYVEYFGDAARRGQTAGFEIIDIHAACGVLLSNFLSPRNNRRNDMYGGSLHNRARFLIEVIRNIKKKAPGVALSVRLSGIDFEPEGITIEETVEVAKMCEAAGADAINITWGSHAEVVNAAGLLSKHGANHVEAAQMIKDAVSIPTMLCGGIYSPEIGEELLENGVTDFVGIGKPALADPMWAKKAEEGHPEDIRPCIGCGVGCHDRGMLSGGVVQCAVNASLYKYDGPVYPQAEVSKKVIVVGTGPAGCEAAITAKKCGHEVTLYEKRSIGGVLKEATVSDSKEDLGRLITYYETQLKKNGIDVVFEEANVDTIVKGGYDVAILATGAKVRVPEVKGLDSKEAIYAMDFLDQGAKTDAQNIVVVGGGIVGAETALILAEEQGKNVTITTRSPEFFVSGVMGIAYMTRLAMAGVKNCPKMQLIAIEDGKPVFVGPRGIETMDVDQVIISSGFIPTFNKLRDEIEAASDEIEVVGIGDCMAPRMVMDAVHEGYIAGINI